jgi:hypothetical protein
MTLLPCKNSLFENHLRHLQEKARKMNDWILKLHNFGAEI